MKKISLGVVAILLAAATVFANSTETKTSVKKAKQECQGRCLKTFKSQTCKDKNTCPDMRTCEGKCS
jgi:hypothetical protein